jgi:hypothetical protein
MIKAERKSINPEILTKVYDRVYINGQSVFVPDVVAERYGIRGKKMTERELLHELKGCKFSRLFRKYLFSDCRNLSLCLLFHS